MTRVVAVVLLAFVVFTCGDPVNVEKRVMPVGPLGSGLDLLSKAGLGDDALKAVLIAAARVVKQIRISLEQLNVCPNKKGDHKDGGYGHYEPGHKPVYEPGYVPSYEPGYEPIYEPSYEPGYEPDYVPSGTYKRNAEVSKLDTACELLKPLLKLIVKLLKQLEKVLGCMIDKEKDYKGDYKDCKEDYNNAYPHDYKNAYPQDNKNAYPPDYKNAYPHDYKSGY